MWLCTKLGFFSVVKARSGTANANMLVVRARDREHLVRLCEWSAFDPKRIVSDAGTDYQYRIVVHKSEFAQVVYDLVIDINYDNFKSMIHEVWGEGKLYKSCMRIWAVLADVYGTRIAHRYPRT